MSKIIKTRLRYIKSKNAESLVLYLESLTYMVEIKGNPVLKNNKWHLWFVLPEREDLTEAPWGDID